MVRPGRRGHGRPAARACARVARRGDAGGGTGRALGGDETDGGGRYQEHGGGRSSSPAPQPPTSLRIVVTHPGTGADPAASAGPRRVMGGATVVSAMTDAKTASRAPVTGRVRHARRPEPPDPRPSRAELRGGAGRGWVAGVLADAGFAVETGAADLPTAFVATVGQRPAHRRASAPSTTPCPGSATRAATTSSPPRPPAPASRSPRSPTTSG